MPASTVSLPTQAEAKGWLDRWDRQQRYYIPDREERFAIVIDVVAEVVDRPDPLVVDLGIGPGSLAHRLLAQIPNAQVVGVDADPLLMQLGALAQPDERLRTVRADLREPSWYDALGLDRAPDAYVSSTALHWMDREPLRQLIATCGHNLAPGGAFADADHLYEGKEPTKLDDLGKALTQRRIERTGALAAETWQEWWAAVESAPELADLVAERAGGFDHTVTDRPTVDDYLTFLREGGFRTAGVVWRYGDDHVIAGLA